MTVLSSLAARLYRLRALARDDPYLAVEPTREVEPEVSDERAGGGVEAAAAAREASTLPAKEKKPCAKASRNLKNTSPPASSTRIWCSSARERYEGKLLSLSPHARQNLPVRTVQCLCGAMDLHGF